MWKAQHRPIVSVVHPSSIGIVDFIRMHGRRWCIETLVTSHRTADTPRKSGSRDYTIVTIPLIWSSIGWLAVDSHHDRGARDRLIAIVHPTDVSSDGLHNSWKNSTIAVRSNHDRGTYVAESLHSIKTTIDGDPGPWSMPDRDPIVARSWPNHGSFEAKLRLNPPPNRGGIVVELNPWSMPKEPLPRRY